MIEDYNKLKRFKDKNILISLIIIALFFLLIFLLSIRFKEIYPSANKSQNLAAGEILLNILKKKGE